MKADIRIKFQDKIPFITKTITLISVIGCVAFVVYGFQNGVFESKENLMMFIQKSGVWGPILFTLIQALQVVIPILPGFVTCIAGAVVFGSLIGFLYSYLGMCVGSVLAFYIARRYGTGLVKKLVKEATYEKYALWLDKGKKFDIFFMLAIFLPAAPDDLLCFLAGLTKMNWKKFTMIILLGKPFVIALYSIGTFGFSRFFPLI